MDSYVRADWEETGGRECPYCGSEDVRDLEWMEPVPDGGLLRVPYVCVRCGEFWWLLLQVWAWEDFTRAEREKYRWLELGEADEDAAERERGCA